MSHSQAFDSTTPMGKFTMTMFAALGELEVETIRERVEAGLDYARKHGTKRAQARHQVRQSHRASEAGVLIAQMAFGFARC